MTCVCTKFVGAGREYRPECGPPPDCALQQVKTFVAQGGGDAEGEVKDAELSEGKRVEERLLLPIEEGIGREDEQGDDAEGERRPRK